MTKQHSFFQLHIAGGASLRVSKSNYSLIVNELYGETTGHLTIFSGQYTHMNMSIGYLPFSLLTQKGANVSLPQHLTCRGVDVVLRGTLDKLVNLTVGPHCVFNLDSPSDNHYVFDHVVVQTDGSMIVKQDLSSTYIKGVTWDIRGGGQVSYTLSQEV